MARTIIPIHIKPHLVPFLYGYFDETEANYNNKNVKALLVNSKNEIGKLIRLLLVKTNKKPSYDTSAQNFLSIQEYPINKSFIRKVYPFNDGRSSFLVLPKEGEVIINDLLESYFEIALYNFIHGWKKSDTAEGIDQAIIDFLSRFHLEEYQYTVLGVRRSYYRKLKSDYFEGKKWHNTLTNKIESA